MSFNRKNFSIFIRNQPFQFVKRMYSSSSLPSFRIFVYQQLLDMVCKWTDAKGRCKLR